MQHVYGQSCGKLTTYIMNTKSFMELYGRKRVSELCEDVLYWHEKVETNPLLNKESCRNMITALLELMEQRAKQQLAEKNKIEEVMKDEAIKNINE